MDKKVKVLAVIPTLRDDPTRLINDLLRQTLPPAKVLIVAGTKHLADYLAVKTLHFRDAPFSIEVLYVKPNIGEHVGVRVGKAINVALEGEELTKYDYLLKLDCDVALHPRCLERCVKLNADLVGLGPFMMIKIEPFMKLLSGRWPETFADDSYIKLLFLAKGLRVEPMPPCVSMIRKGGVHGSWKYYFYRGIDDYRTGFNPLFTMYVVVRLIVKRRTPLPIFTLLGYFFCGSYEAKAL